MKTTLLTALIACLSLRVTAQDVLTFHPLYTERDAILQPTAEGTWLTDFWGPYTVEIRKVGDNFYHVRTTLAQKSTLYEGVFTRSGETLMLDLLPVVSDSLGDEMFRRRIVAVHTPYRVILERDTLRLAALGYPWFYDSLALKGAQASYIWSGSAMILSASTADLRTFIADRAHRPGFFAGELVFHRIGEPAPRPATPHARSPLGPQRAPEGFPGAQRACLPTFPFKDGWQGADGDISIPISPSASFWIFGDSFVGGKDQTSRSGTRMISNTIAITQCAADRSSTIQYYWRDQYTNHPRPFFESHTSRYRYWLAGMFRDGNTLYVIMQKIAPPSGATRPNEVFNWSNAGMSLARIQDPGATTPDKWTIELIPWSSTFDPNSWNGYLAKQGRYIYMFPAGKNRALHLLRLHLDHVESPEGHVEYYATSGTWKKGLSGDDMKTVMEGEAGQSVEYHPDLGQWIMVCGPGFFTNKIRIRTARELTGPWSEERVIYECPEQTPGSPVYDKENFCYLGREHIQYYDSRNRTLVITYDCNSTSLSKLVANPGIYSPRVLTIPLAQ
jgi:hypothetical protein